MASTRRRANDDPGDSAQEPERAADDKRADDSWQLIDATLARSASEGSSGLVFFVFSFQKRQRYATGLDGTIRSEKPIRDSASAKVSIARFFRPARTWLSISSVNPVA